MITFEQISEVILDSEKPPLDRETISEEFALKYFNESENSTGYYIRDAQRSWRNQGYAVIRNAIPEPLIDAYCDRWLKDKPVSKNWRPNTPYIDIEEIKDLCLYRPLVDTLEHLIGYEMGLHLNLCEWTSTERDWHQDDYLNPEYINSHYAAVWFALDEIHPDSGPFQCVPSSHKWPAVRRQKVWDAAPAEIRALPEWGTHWPSLTQGFVGEAFDRKIEESGLPIETFIPANKGDILIWHGNLAHRGSRPNVRGLQRRALIAHYSSIYHRADMPRRARHKNQGVYFVL